MPIDKQTWNLIAAAISLAGALRNYRRASGKIARLRGVIGIATAGYFVYNAYTSRQDRELAR